MESNSTPPGSLEPLPDIDANLSPTALAEVLRLDQRRRWERNQRVPAEQYLAQFPQLLGDCEALVDFVFGEYLLREGAGEKVSTSEFVLRFPACAELLQAQIEFHQIAAEPTQPPNRDWITTTGRQVAEAATWVGLPTPTALVGKFGRYEILRQLGRGGMGTVYLARDTALDRLVALKIPRFDPLDTELIERFQREARIAAQLSHPNLCAIYDVGQIDGVHYLSLTYVPGQSLAECLAKEQPLPLVRAVELAGKIARAVEVAHRAGVLHRDLKPGNVLLGDDGQPIVADFGLARRRQADDLRLTSSGVFLGTPAYAAPEQISGKGEEGIAADIYSLGVILFEMVTGRLPFEGGRESAIQQTLNSPPPKPSQFRPEIDATLDAICLKAMAKQPEARWSSMAEFAESLEGILATPGRTGFTPPVTSPPSRAAPQAAKGANSRWIVGVGVGTAALALLLGVGYFGGFFSRANAPQREDDPRIADVPIRTNVQTGEPVPTIDLIPLVSLANLGAGDIADIKTGDGQLVVDATTERSSNVWVNFPSVRGEELALRCRFRVLNPTDVGFVKLAIQSSAGSEIHAQISHAAGETHAWMEDPHADLRERKFFPLALPAGDETLDMEFVALKDRHELRINGEVAVQQARKKHVDGHAALGVAGWKVEFQSLQAALPKEPRAINARALVPRDLLRDKVEAIDQPLPRGWSIASGRLVSHKGQAVSNLKWDVPLPESYRIDCEFTALAPDDALYWVLPVGPRNHCLFGFGAFPKEGQVWRGFADIDGQPIWQNGTGRKSPSLDRGQPHRLRIEVHTQGDTARLAAQVDDAPPIEWTGPVSQLSLPASYDWPDVDQFGVGSVNASYRIDSLTLTELEGD